MPERRLAVLHVVVQRPVDVGDLAERQRHQRQPVVVEVRELRRRERQRVDQQLTPQQRGGAGDGVRHQQRQQVGVVVAPAVPPGVGDHGAVTGDDPGVGVDQLRVAERGDERRQLVRVPAVVLIGRARPAAASVGRERQRALEVAVEAQPPGRTRHDEARVVADRAARAPRPPLATSSRRRSRTASCGGSAHGSSASGPRAARRAGL